MLNKLIVGAPAAGMLLLGSAAYAKDINEAKREKEERKEALKEAAQVAKDVGTAVVPDGMQVSWSQRNTAFNTSNCPKAMYGVIEMYVLICLLVMHRCIQA